MASTSSIAQILSATLNPDTNTRVAAELKLAESFADFNTGLALVQILLAQDADISLRQISSTTLRKYVLERWSPYFSGFRGAAPSAQIKTQIRQAVFQGLSDPDRRVRSLCAHTLASIAGCDWPDEYPDLLDNLINQLSSGSSDSIHGAMQLFAEFIKSDVTEDQLLPLLRQLLPVLLNILGATESHSPLTRARTISVFRECIAALSMVKDQHPQSVKEAVASVLPVWFEAFKVLLNIDPMSDIRGTKNWDGLAVRIQIFKSLTAISTAFNKAITPSLMVDFLIISVRHLNTLFPVYDHFYLAEEEAIPKTSEDETIDLVELICPIFDFIAEPVRLGKSKQWLETNVQQIVQQIFDYVQITLNDEETWAVDANAFVAQEADESQYYSMRVVGFDCLSALIEKLPAPTIRAMTLITDLIIQSSSQARESGNSHWWRPLEAALAAVGSEADWVLDCVQDEEDSGRVKPIDIEGLLANIIPNLLGLPQQPFLQGRGFLFASQFAHILPLHSSGQYLEAGLLAIESPEAGIPVQISALRAVRNFFQEGGEKELSPFAARLAKDLIPILSAASEDTLGLALETLSVVIKVDRGSWVTPDLATSMTQAIVEVWHKNSRDPIFVSILTDSLRSLVEASSGIFETVVKIALPLLCQIIGNTKKGEAWIASSAIGLVTSLVEGAAESRLGEGFFSLLAPPLFACLADAEDRDVIQNGILLLTVIVRKDCNQMTVWTDAEGRNGLDYTLKLLEKMLQSQDESGGLVIGDLMIHLFREAGKAIVPVLPRLLQAMIVSMKSAKTATFIQSLVCPFAFLLTTQFDAILDLLESTIVNGRLGLEILLQTWCENAETFQGLWASRISTLGLAELLISERPSLRNITVKGELIVKPETKNVIMTRSKTKNTVAAPHEFTSLPFPVKALKIIIHDLQSGGESATLLAQGNTFDVESDDGDEEWTEGDGQNQGESALLSELLGPKGFAFDNDDLLDVSDDESLRNDPVSKMDMQAHLVNFLKNCVARNTASFNQIVDQLSAEEMLVLRSAVGNQ